MSIEPTEYAGDGEPADILARLDAAMVGFNMCLPGARTAREAAEEIRRLRAVVEAAQEWSGERSVNDWDEATLMKAIWTFNGDRAEPCPECDGECGEPCAPCTVVAAHAAIDQRLATLVKQGKLHLGEPLNLGPNV